MIGKLKARPYATKYIQKRKAAMYKNVTKQCSTVTVINTPITFNETKWKIVIWQGDVLNDVFLDI